MLVINYGRDAVKITKESLEKSDIAHHIKPGMKVSLKPNLVVSRPASEGATTHPEVVEGIILYLKEYGIRDIKIIESAWIGDATKLAFRICGYEDLKKRYGVSLIDLKDDAYTVCPHGNMSIQVHKEALETDFLINVPVLKAHCQTRLTCCMKNLKGCIPDNEKSRFHSLGLHKPIAALNAIIKTGYCVVDGICGDLDFEEGGNPVTANRVIVGQNPVLVDSFCAGLIGYKPEDIGYLTEAKRLGLGTFYTPDTPITQLNAQDKPRTEAKSSRMAERYRSLINEDAACSVCYSSLIHALHRLRGQTKYKDGIAIGQGFKDKTGKGLGIGNCASGFGCYVEGCPPKASDIIKAL